MTSAFLLTSFIIVASPGTGAVYTIATGLYRGSRASIVAAFGCTLGILPHITAAVLGVTAILHTSALLFETIKYLGVAYLLYMAWAMLKSRGALSLDSSQTPTSAVKIIMTAILINVLNPKLSIFFFAFLPQFIIAGEPYPLARMLELSGVFMMMTFLVFALYGVFASAMRDHVLSRPSVLKWIRCSFAAVFVALGAKLALTER